MQGRLDRLLRWHLLSAGSLHGPQGCCDIVRSCGSHLYDFELCVLVVYHVAFFFIIIIFVFAFFFFVFVFFVFVFYVFFDYIHFNVVIHFDVCLNRKLFVSRPNANFHYARQLRWMLPGRWKSSSSYDARVELKLDDQRCMQQALYHRRLHVLWHPVLQ